MLKSGVGAPTGVMGVQQPPDIQTAIGALRAKLGGGRMPAPGESPPIVNVPTGARTPPAPAGPAMSYPLRVGPAGAGQSPRWDPIKSFQEANPTGPGGATGMVGVVPPEGFHNAADPGFARQPSQFDRDAAATGRWRGAARFAGGTPGGAQPTGPLPGSGPLAVAGMGADPGLQSAPQDVGVNQVPTANPFLQAALARQQQLGGGYGALLRGALQPQMAG